MFLNCKSLFQIYQYRYFYVFSFEIDQFWICRSGILNKKAEYKKTHTTMLSLGQQFKLVRQTLACICTTLLIIAKKTLYTNFYADGLCPESLIIICLVRNVDWEKWFINDTSSGGDDSTAYISRWLEFMTPSMPWKQT